MSPHDIMTLARETMDEHGLHQWRLYDDTRATTRAGVCKWHERRIGLNIDLLAKWPPLDAADVILHEVAHALAFRKHGPRHRPHGAQWKAIAESIGAEPTRCYDAVRLPKPDAKWVGTCRVGHTYERSRQPSEWRTCLKCDRKTVTTLHRVLDWRHVETGKRPDGKRYTQSFRHDMKRFREAYAAGDLPPLWGSPKDPYACWDDGDAHWDYEEHEFDIDLRCGYVEPLIPEHAERLLALCEDREEPPHWAEAA